MQRYDVAVLGGGPAGTATALALARSRRSVVLLEASHYQRPKLGETLPPAARVPLTRLGAWDRFLASGHAASPGNASAWGESQLRDDSFIFHAYGDGWHLDRVRFDGMMADAANDAGATIHRGARLVSCESLANREWRCTFEHDGIGKVIHAQFLVDATGRSARHARQAGSRRITCDRMIAMAAEFDGGSVASDDTRTLVEAAQSGWWYTASLPGTKVIAVYMTDSDLLPNNLVAMRECWWRELRRSRHTLQRVRALSFRGPLRIVTASSSALDRITGDDWLCVGDAARTFDPLSSRGIITALETGLLAAAAIESRCNGDVSALTNFEGNLREEFDEYLVRRAREYARERRWCESAFWQRRHSPPLS